MLNFSKCFACRKRRDLFKETRDVRDLLQLADHMNKSHPEEAKALDTGVNLLIVERRLVEGEVKSDG